MSQPQTPPFGLRMPETLKLKLKDIAWQNRRSMNSEIVTILERAVVSYENESPTTAATVSGSVHQQ